MAACRIARPYTMVRSRQRLLSAAAFLLAVMLPLVIGVSLLQAWKWDLSIPFVYPLAPGDETWQLSLTKMLRDTGWVLSNPYLGAPEVASWHHNAAAQTSPLHSIVMLAMAPFIHDAVRLQQVYFLMCFGLIGGFSYCACRLLGIARVASVCVGVMFALITYRWYFRIYSFIPNYWAVPLGMVAVYWCITGQHGVLCDGPRGWGGAIGRLARAPRFWIGMVGVLLVTASDGYYAFFMLLLLAFCAGCRMLAGDWRHPRRLLPPAAYGAALLVLSLCLTAPLSLYKATHRDEFFPGGVEDSALIKQPFEAEVYAVSFKMLLMPWPNHQIPAMARLGRYMQASSDLARKYPVAPFTLGAVGSVLMLMFLARMIRSAMIVRRSGSLVIEPVAAQAPNELEAVVAATSGLTLFIMLGSISGGIGSLIALVFPTIRAYDRFPLFLLFALLCGAAAWWTLRQQHMTKRGRRLMTVALIVVTAFSVYDQTPSGMAHRPSELAPRFLAERRFVHQLEAALPPGAMVDFYPYSQYLVQSKHYGWGSFAHVRLYLHSNKLHWSSGASKNSAVDNWQARLAALPSDQLLTELQAAGFAAMTIDRRVIADAEYAQIVAAARALGMPAPVEDEASRLAYIRIPDPGYRLIYEPNYRQGARIEVQDIQRMLQQPRLSRVLRRDVVRRLLEGDATNVRIERTAHPEAFDDVAQLDRGLGVNPIEPLERMQGVMSCTGSPGGVELKLSNNSDFLWRLGSGPAPLRIGVHLKSSDGSMLAWDDGIRLEATGYLPPGQTAHYSFSWSQLPAATLSKRQPGATAEFMLLQEGHAWFNTIACLTALPDSAP